MRGLRKILFALIFTLAVIIIGTIVTKIYGYSVKLNNALPQLTSSAKEALNSAISQISEEIEKIANNSSSSSVNSSENTNSSKNTNSSSTPSKPAIPIAQVTQKPSSTDAQSVVSVPIAAEDIQSVWGKTGMDGLTVYEYGKTLLNDDEKSVYCRLADAVRNIEKSVTITTSLSTAQIKKIYEYYVYDHREVFYMSGTDLQYTQYKKYYTYKFIFRYNYDKAQIITMRDKLQAAAKQALGAAEGKATDYKKEKALHDYLIKNCYYDLNAAENPSAYPESFSAYGALVNGKAVCEGYADSMKLLLSSVGIKTLYLTGQGNGNSHAWNEVNIGGKWYFLDATFDDPVFVDKSGNYVNSNTCSYTYFNFKSRSDHVLGSFNSSDPFANNSENYEIIP